MNRSKRFRETGGYILAAAIPLLIVFHVLHLWSYDLSIPLKYRGDSTIPALYAKAVSESGWYTHIDRIGMPTGFVLYDYPNLQTIPFAVIRVMSLIGIDGFGRLQNLYFLFTISITSLIAYYTLRRFGLSIPAGVTGGVVFTLLPCHFMRGVSQLELTSYFIVPLVMLLAVRLHEYSLSDRRERGFMPDIRLSRTVSLIVSCILIGLSSIYYVFFSVLALFVAGVSAAGSRRDRRPLVHAATLVFLIGIVTVLNFSPVFIHRIISGDNDFVARRTPGSSLNLGMPLSSLVIPAEESRIGFIQRIQEMNHSAFRRQGMRRNPGNYIGIIGVIGGLILMVRALTGRYGRVASPLRPMVLICFTFILLGAIGGLGYLFALLVSPMFRGWDRCVVFVAFPAIAASVSECDRCIGRFKRRSLRTIITGIVFVSIILVAARDQTGEAYRRGVSASDDPDRAYGEFHTDEQFVQLMEALIPTGGMIIQLPHTYWPESGEMNELPMHHYDHVRMYLHSTHARWSFPAMHGRPGELWIRRTSSEPVAEMLESLVILDFSGIYLDRWGYPDSARSIVRELRIHTKTEPIQSADGRMLFFPLGRYAEEYERHVNSGERDRLLASECIVHAWFPGRNAPRKKSNRNFWCSSDPRLRISNISSERIAMELRIAIETPGLRSCTITVTGEDRHLEWDIHEGRGLFHLEAVVRPGSLEFDVRIDEPPMEHELTNTKHAFKILGSEILKAHWFSNDVL